MTSQRDEATRHPAGEGMTDDPIVIERRDEILTSDDPADDGPGAEASAPATTARATGGPGRPALKARGMKVPVVQKQWCEQWCGSGADVGRI